MPAHFKTLWKSQSTSTPSGQLALEVAEYQYSARTESVKLYLPICHFWLNTPATDNSEPPVALLMYKEYGTVKNPPSSHSKLTQVNVCMPCSLATFQTMLVSCQVFSGMLQLISANECDAVPQFLQTSFFSHTMFFINPTQRIPVRWG
jgi:hypothetical protein